MSLADDFLKDAAAGANQGTIAPSTTTSTAPTSALASQFMSEAASAPTIAAPTADTAPPSATTQALRAAYQGLNRVNPLGPLLNALGTGDPVQDTKNLAGGAIRGAGSIGSTIAGLYDVPSDILAGRPALQSNKERRAAIDQGLTGLLGSDPTSGLYQLGKTGGEVAGTAGAGPLIAGGVRALPVIGNAAGPLAEAIASGGMRTGLNPSNWLEGLGNLGIRTAGGAISGGAQAAMVDPSHAEKGAMIGGAIPVATKVAGLGGNLAGQIWDAAAPVITPTRYVGRGIASSLTPAEAAQAAHNIANAPTFVPGSTPTSAQVAGSPVLVQTEKAAGNLPGFKTAQVTRDIANNQARWQALTDVAQTPAALDAAQTARAATSTPLYNAAHAETAQIGSDYARFAANPDVQQAMREGAAANATDVLARRTPVTAMFPEASANGRTINASAVDYTSRALGDMISVAQRAGQDARAGSLTAIKNQIDNWASNALPGMQRARAAYAAGSVPVNTMEAGQQISEALGNKALNAAGDLPQMQLTAYSSALQRALRNAEHGIDPGAQQTLEGITRDLQRGTVSNSIRSPGSDTGYNLAADSWLARQLYGPTFQGAGGLAKGVGLLGATLAGHPYAGAAAVAGANRAGQFVGGRLQNSLSDLLMNPAQLAPYLSRRGAQAISTPGLLSAANPFLLRSAPSLLTGGG